MDKKAKVYADACCFVEMASHLIGRHKPERDRDVAYLKAIFQAHFEGKLAAHTSVLSIAECQYAGSSTNKLLTDDIKSLFKRFLTSGQYLALIQPTVVIGEKARNLYWAHGLNFRGADALHIASALELDCVEFLTFDDRILKAAKELDALGLRVIPPRDTHILPESYNPFRHPLIDTVGTTMVGGKTDEGKQTTKTAESPAVPVSPEVSGSDLGRAEDQAGDEGKAVGGGNPAKQGTPVRPREEEKPRNP